MNYLNYYIENLFKAISFHEEIVIEKTNLGKPNKNLAEEKLAELPFELTQYLANLDGILLNWNHPEKEEVFGGLNIMALQHLFDETVLEIQPELVVVNDDLSFSKKKQLAGVFRRVDLFASEASIGFFSDNQMGKEFYYCTRHYFYLLNLNFEQYFKLLCEAKGFTYWQLAIINLEYGYGKLESEWFQEQMPKLFPSFSFDAFITLYQKFKQEYLFAKEQNG